MNRDFASFARKIPALFVLFFAGQDYGRLKVSTRNLAISARVTEFSGQ